MHELGVITGRVDKINRRAARLGLEPVNLTVSPPRTELVTDPDTDDTYVIEVADVTVDVPSICLDGWEFLGRIDHNEGLVAARPGCNVPLAPFTDEATCEHCGLDRDRNVTYVVRHEDGTIRQVGSTCLDDFLGIKVNLHVWHAALKLDADLNELDGRYSHADGHLSLDTFLTAVAHIVRTSGWVPRSASWGIPTADEASAVFTGMNGHGLRSEFTDADADDAAAAVAWAKNLDPTDDYLHNLKVIATNGFVTPRSVGLAASLINAWQRAIGRDLAGSRTTAPVPHTTERITIRGHVIKVDAKENYHGGRTTFRQVITVADDRGFTVWGTCPRAISQVRVTDVVQFDATVERSDRDETFGYFGRPSKATIVTEGDDGALAA